MNKNNEIQLCHIISINPNSYDPVNQEVVSTPTPRIDAYDLNEIWYEKIRLDIRILGYIYINLIAISIPAKLLKPAGASIAWGNEAEIFIIAMLWGDKLFAILGEDIFGILGRKKF